MERELENYHLYIISECPPPKFYFAVVAKKSVRSGDLAKAWPPVPNDEVF